MLKHERNIILSALLFLCRVFLLFHVNYKKENQQGNLC